MMSKDIKHSVMPYHAVCHCCGHTVLKPNRFSTASVGVSDNTTMYVRLCDDCLEGIVRFTLLKKIGVKP